jgi:hypothetical protein
MSMRRAMDLASLEAEHGDTASAFDHVTAAIRNYHDSGTVRGGASLAQLKSAREMRSLAPAMLTASAAWKRQLVVVVHPGGGLRVLEVGDELGRVAAARREAVRGSTARDRPQVQQHRRAPKRRDATPTSDEPLVILQQLVGQAFG